MKQNSKINRLQRVIVKRLAFDWNRKFIYQLEVPRSSASESRGGGKCAWPSKIQLSKNPREIDPSS